MAEEGLLAPDARVELIEGEIVEMPFIGSRHAECLSTLAHLFHRAAGSGAWVITQMPVRLGSFAEPQPDLALLKMRQDRYRYSHPWAQNVLLLVEVSASSLPYDRDIKVPLYAEHGIPEVWIVDLEGRQLLVHRSPVDGRYRDVSAASSGFCSPSLAPHVQIDLSEVL